MLADGIGDVIRHLVEEIRISNTYALLADMTEKLYEWTMPMADTGRI